jgi:Tfp pilus assembly protein PilO
VRLILDKLNKLDNKIIKIIILVSVFLLIFLIGYLTSTRILKHKLALLLNKHSELNQRLETQGNLLKYKDQEKTSAINKIYDKPIDLEFFIGQIVQVATANSIMLVAIKPLPATQEELITIYPLQIVVSGSYLKLAMFTEKLIKALPYLTVLQEIKITKLEDKNNSLNMQVLLAIYGIKNL